MSSTEEYTPQPMPTPTGTEEPLPPTVHVTTTPPPVVETRLVGDHDVAVPLGVQPAEQLPVHDVAPPIRSDFRPTVVDVPHAYQDGSTLVCTVGNWNGEPYGYGYVWRRDGMTAGTGASYPVALDDVGHTFDCVVTATNAGGSTEVTSNTVVAA